MRTRAEGGGERLGMLLHEPVGGGGGLYDGLWMSLQRRLESQPTISVINSVLIFLFRSWCHIQFRGRVEFRSCCGPCGPIGKAQNSEFEKGGHVTFLDSFSVPFLRDRCGGDSRTLWVTVTVTLSQSAGEL
jgi:hypothetical protein